MSAFREALKAGGHGEWIIETGSPSGEVRLRKVNERAADAEFVIAAPTPDGISPKEAV